MLELDKEQTLAGYHKAVDFVEQAVVADELEVCPSAIRRLVREGLSEKVETKLFVVVWGGRDNGPPIRFSLQRSALTSLTTPHRIVLPGKISLVQPQRFLSKIVHLVIAMADDPPIASD